MVGTPIALGVSIYAFARGQDRPFALLALVLSSLETLCLAAAFLSMLFLG